MVRSPNRIASFCLFSALMLFAPHQPLQARDLTGRLGVGFANNWSNSASAKDLPVLSAKYHLSRELSVAGNLGADLGTGNNRMVLGAKFFRNFILEPLTNFYVGGGVGYLKGKSDGTKENGVELKGVFGAEFFFQGIESIGFNFETGVATTFFDDEFRLKFTGELFNAGVHFYF